MSLSIRPEPALLTSAASWAQHVVGGDGPGAVIAKPKEPLSASALTLSGDCNYIDEAFDAYHDDDVS